MNFYHRPVHFSGTQQIGTKPPADFWTREKFKVATPALEKIVIKDPETKIEKNQPYRRPQYFKPDPTKKMPLFNEWDSQQKALKELIKDATHPEVKIMEVIDSVNSLDEAMSVVDSGIINNMVQITAFLKKIDEIPASTSRDLEEKEKIKDMVKTNLLTVLDSAKSNIVNRNQENKHDQLRHAESANQMRSRLENVHNIMKHMTVQADEKKEFDRRFNALEKILDDQFELGQIIDNMGLGETKKVPISVDIPNLNPIAEFPVIERPTGTSKLERELEMELQLQDKKFEQDTGINASQLQLLDQILAKADKPRGISDRDFMRNFNPSKATEAEKKKFKNLEKARQERIKQQREQKGLTIVTSGKKPKTEAEKKQAESDRRFLRSFGPLTATKAEKKRFDDLQKQKGKGRKKKKKKKKKKR